MAGYNPLILPVDTVLISSLASPGIARVVGFASRRKVDVRGAYGISATIAVWREVAEGKVVIELRTDEDWDLWDVWSRATVLKEMRANKRNKASDYALDIWHPWLEMLDIKSVIVKSVSQPEEIAPTVWAITIDLIEYRKATMTLSKPEAAKQKEEDDPFVDPILREKTKELNRLNQELAELG